MSNDICAAIDNLRENQKQLDMDGCMVGVSRQALDQVLQYIADLVPRQAVTGDAKRETFENWITANGDYPHLKHKSFGGNYLHEEVAMKWDGFKEGFRAALQTPSDTALRKSHNELLGVALVLKHGRELPDWCKDIAGQAVTGDACTVVDAPIRKINNTEENN